LCSLLPLFFSSVRNQMIGRIVDRDPVSLFSPFHCPPLLFFFFQPKRPALPIVAAFLPPSSFLRRSAFARTCSIVGCSLPYLFLFLSFFPSFFFFMVKKDGERQKSHDRPGLPPVPSFFSFSFPSRLTGLSVALKPPSLSSILARHCGRAEEGLAAMERAFCGLTSPFLPFPPPLFFFPCA